MPRKAKKKVHPMPKLGFMDILLYWAAMIGCGVGMALCLILPIVSREQAALESPKMIAFGDANSSGRFFWLFFWLLVVLIMIGAGPYRNRFPIFGRRDIRYGPPAYPRIYPLLMKDKPQYWVSPKKQALQKKLYLIGAIVLAITLLFSAEMFRQSLVARTELNRGGSISVYDCQNQETVYYSTGNIRSVRLDTHTTGSRRTRKQWTIGIWLTTSDGKTFHFTWYSFRGDRTEALRTMIAIKERYADLVTIEGIDKLDRVIRDWDLDETEIALLYELFDIE